MLSAKIQEIFSLKDLSSVADKNDANRFGLFDVIFICLFALILTDEVNNWQAPAYVRQVGVLVWFVVVLLFGSKIRLNETVGLIKPLLLIFFLPKLLIWLYGQSLYLFGIADITYLSTGFTQISSVLVPLSAFYIFGRKSIHYIFIAALLSFFATLVITVGQEGFLSLLAPIEALINGGLENPFENSQASFLATFLFIYYVCLSKDKGAQRIFPAVMCGVMVLFGYKRIALAAILLVLAFVFLSSRVKKNTAFRLCRAVGLTCLIASWCFILLVDSGWLTDFLQGNGISMMSRNYYWEIACSWVSFSPEFLGLGLNSTSQIFVTEYSYLGVGGVHSDILKHYCELGFFGFLFWSFYYFLILPKLIELSFGKYSSYGYYVLNLLAFGLCLTDNIDIYLGSQIVLVLGSVCYAVNNRIAESDLESIRIDDSGVLGQQSNEKENS
jgi:hypothetical protein